MASYILTSTSTKWNQNLKVKNDKPMFIVNVHACVNSFAAVLLVLHCLNCVASCFCLTSGTDYMIASLVLRPRLY